MNKITKYLKCTMNKTPVVIAQMHEHTMKVTDYSGKEIYYNPEKLVDGIIQVYNQYDFNQPFIGYDVYNIEAEAMGFTVDAFENSTPQISFDSKVDIEDLADNLEISSPIRDQGRFEFVLESRKYFIEKTGLIPHLEFTAPFSLAAQMIGLENLLMNIQLEPALVHDLMKKINNRVLKPWLDLQIEEFPESQLILGADAMASPPNLNLEMLEKFVVPYIKDLKEEFGSKVGVVNWWGESYFEKIENLLKLKKQVAPYNGMLRVQDPDIPKINMNKIMDFVIKNDLTLTLGLGASFIVNSSKEELQGRVENYVHMGQGAKDFTLYLCNIGQNTDETKIDLAINTARESLRSQKRWIYPANSA